MEYIAIIVMALIIAYQAVEKWEDRRQGNQRIDDLLNRVMSSDFGQYAAGTHRLKSKPDQPKTAKERMAELDVMREAADLIPPG